MVDNGISIVIPTYKQKLVYLIGAIRSVASQTWFFDENHHGEIILVDDGGEENLKLFVNSIYCRFYGDYESQTFKSFDKEKNLYKIELLDETNLVIKIISLGQNQGTAASLNAGIEASNPEFKYFGWLSSDDFIYPQFLETHLTGLQNSNCKISYSGYSEIVYDKDFNLLSIAQYRPSVLDDIGCSKDFQGIVNVDIKDFQTSLVKCLHRRSCSYNGCAFVFEKSLFNEVGFFREDYKFVQDFSMWLQMSKCKSISSILMFPQTLMCRREHSGRTQYLYDEETFLKQKTWEFSDMFNKFIGN